MFEATGQAPGERIGLVQRPRVFEVTGQVHGNEFDLSGDLGFSRPLDKYLESKFDLSSGLGFSRPLDKHPVYELRGAEPAQPAAPFGLVGESDPVWDSRIETQLRVCVRVCVCEGEWGLCAKACHLDPREVS